MKKRNAVHTLCILALLTAMMVLLSLTVSIRTPYFKLTLGSLPVVLAAMLFGPLEGAAVAVLGEFMVQLLSYGLMPTTVIWICPPAIRALVVGGAAIWMRRQGRRLEERPVVCYGVCVAGAVLTTVGNTVGMWLESLMYRTSFAAAAFWVPSRFVSGIATAMVVATACMPLTCGLRRSGVLGLEERA